MSDTLLAIVACCSMLSAFLMAVFAYRINEDWYKHCKKMNREWYEVYKKMTDMKAEAKHDE